MHLLTQQRPDIIQSLPLLHILLASPAQHSIYGLGEAFCRFFHTPAQLSVRVAVRSRQKAHDTDASFDEQHPIASDKRLD